MIKKILEWILGFFDKNEDLSKIENKVEQKEKELEEIENEEHSNSDIDEYLNK